MSWLLIAWLGCADDPVLAVPACGDGVLDVAEVCDDANAVSGDGCNATCTSEEFCGNGILDAASGEQCEDGNTTGGDGCSEGCAVEPRPSCGDGQTDDGEDCDDGNATAGDGCSPRCTDEVCGNGILDPGEGCEDGNLNSGDGCSDGCAIELLSACGNGELDDDEECDDGDQTAGDGCGPFCIDEACGNGILDPNEACEDGNAVAGDGCNPVCAFETTVCGDDIVDPGESCDDGDLTAGDGCGPLCQTEICGNGILDPDEDCEDGNVFDGDGCSTGCEFEGLLGGFCGDDTQDPGEGCDDGATVDGDGCSHGCWIEACGNGYLDADEACEDGNVLDGDGCSAQCLAEAYGPSCGDGKLDPGEDCDDGDNDAGDGCGRGCWLEFCGNGVLELGEQCEDGDNTSGDGCDADCQVELPASCGDGVLDASEECDDGDAVPGDGCGPFCIVEGCGNGLLDIGEGCEDGNDRDGDGCSALCEIEISGEGCGDGLIDPGEECDDANLAAGDGCGTYCIVEQCGNGILDPGESCEDGDALGGDGCSAVCLAEVCGNGRLDMGEACDDGARLNGDGCTSGCTLEAEGCGDGDVAPTEGCDDGNLTPLDGCTAACVLETCGDGNLDLAEVCDDGNAIETDACPTTCRPATCGDGRVHATDEQCDDGGLVPGDGCSPACLLETCGNGILDPGETCDDGNAVQTDSCAACEPASCGDGWIFAGFERCDDGGNEDLDGCSADCSSTEACGNGVIDAGELCDDGNLDDDDSCPSTCHPATCGDGFVWDPIEGCDDGDLIDGDGCSAACTADGCGNGIVEDGEACDEGAGNGTHGSACFPTCQAATASFGTAVVIPTDNDPANHGNGPRYLDLKDYNGDGRMDVAFANSSSGEVTVAMGLGSNLGFWTPNQRTVGTLPQQVAVADIDKDGLVDAVVTNQASDSISVLDGDGRGVDDDRTHTTVISAGGDGPTGLVLADFDADGDIDAATSNLTSDDVVVLLNNGTGTLTASARYPTLAGATGDGPVDVAFGDVTGDGLGDLVSCNANSDDVTVLRGLGSGLFALHLTTTLRIGAGGDNPQAIALGDHTGDGVLDITTANHLSSDIVVLVANGAGGFAPPVRFDTLFGAGLVEGEGPAGIGVSDLDGDGELDVVTANMLDEDVSILFGVSGGAAFDPAIGVWAQSDCDDPDDIALADVDNDGDDDIIALCSVSENVAVIMNLGGRVFSDARLYEVRSGYAGENAEGIATGDFNGDGNLDVVATMSVGNHVTVVAGLGDGVLAASQTTIVDDTMYDVVGGMLTEDMDWVAVSSNNAYLFRGDQDAAGNFDITSTFSTFSGGEYPYSVDLGDLDGDGDLDAAFVAENDDGLVAYTMSTLSTVYKGTAFVCNGPRSIRLVDVSGDSKLDAVMACRFDHTVHVATGTGAAAFTPYAMSLSTSVGISGKDPLAIWVEDVNGDGYHDILTANEDTNDVSYLQGTATPLLFAPAKIVPVVSGGTTALSTDLATGDFNADGYRDLVVANPGRDSVSIILGFGNGNWSSPTEIVVASDQPYGVGVWDADLDGDDDVVATAYGGDALLFLPGT